MPGEQDFPVPLGLSKTPSRLSHLRIPPGYMQVPDPPVLEITETL